MPPAGVLSPHRARRRPGRTSHAPCPDWRKNVPRRPGTSPASPASRVSDWAATSTVTVPCWTCKSSLSARRVGLAHVMVTRAQGPVPQFNHVRRLGAGHQYPAAAGFAAPQSSALTTARDLHRLRPRGLDQCRQSYTERVADPEQGSHAGIGGTLLHVDYHPAAYPRRLRQLIKRPAPRLPLLLHPGADG